MTVQDIYTWLDGFAPFDSQDEFDNAGLLIGDPSARVSRILFTLDVTLASVRAAKAAGAELIISHHPLMFRPVQKLISSSGEGAVITSLAASGISLIAAHTNLDICQGGVADVLADTIGLKNVVGSDASPYLRTGSLPAPLTAVEFGAALSRSLAVSVRMYGNPDKLIRSVAIVPGAGGDIYPHASADGFVTGEIRHHEIIGAVEEGMIVFDAGHYFTEAPGIKALYNRFQTEANKQNWDVQAMLHQQQPYPCTSCT